MSFRILHVLFVSTLSSMLALGAQTSVTPNSTVKNAKTTVDAARALVRDEALAVESIDDFEVSHQVDITSVAPHYNQTTHAYLKTWVQRPGHIRVESLQYNHSKTIVSDGSTTWIYDGDDWKQARSVPTSLFSNAFPGLAHELGSANLPSIMTEAKIVGTEQLLIARRNYSCDIIDVSVLQSASNGTLLNNMLRLWVSREYKVPLKVEATFVGATPEDRKKYSDFVTDFNPGLNIPGSVWKFNQPGDSK